MKNRQIKNIFKACHKFGIFSAEAKKEREIYKSLLCKTPLPVAVLSTTVLPHDGTYDVYTLSQGDIPDISGIPHYIGHPDTKNIVESLGAIPSPTKLFAGLQPGQSAICFPIHQGLSSRANDGFTSPHQNVDLSMLSVRVITRVDKGGI